MACAARALPRYRRLTCRRRGRARGRGAFRSRAERIHARGALGSGPDQPALRRGRPGRLTRQSARAPETGSSAAAVGDGQTAGRARWAKAAMAPEGHAVRQRVTLTQAALSAARYIFFLVSGEEKRAALQTILRGDAEAERWPAAQLRASRERVWWADRAAHGARAGVVIAERFPFAAPVPAPTPSFRFPAAEAGSRAGTASRPRAPSSRATPAHDLAPRPA